MKRMTSPAPVAPAQQRARAWLFGTWLVLVIFSAAAVLCVWARASVAVVLDAMEAFAGSAPPAPEPQPATSLTATPVTERRAQWAGRPPALPATESPRIEPVRPIVPPLPQLRTDFVEWDHNAFNIQRARLVELLEQELERGDADLLDTGASALGAQVSGLGSYSILGHLGLLNGDRVQLDHGAPLASLADLTERIASHPPGGICTLNVVRDEEAFAIELSLYD